MKQKSWGCTVITQLSLCIAAYIALSIGQPQKDPYFNNGRPLDMYFITVAGGFRLLQEQTLLLKQMVNVARTYKARFVVDITEFGVSAPLLKNDQSSAPGNDQINSLTRTLKESDDDWRIVAGFHRLVSNENKIRKSEQETSFGICRKYYSFIMEWMHILIQVQWIQHLILLPQIRIWSIREKREADSFSTRSAHQRWQPAQCDGPSTSVSAATGANRNSILVSHRQMQAQTGSVYVIRTEVKRISQ